MAKRKTALTYITYDYAKNGKDTGLATRHYIESRISLKAYTEAAKLGLEIFNKANNV